MVYHDGSVENSLDNNTKNLPAGMLDRTFSFFLDYVIFAPAVSFLNLLLFQDELAVWKKTGTSLETAPLLVTLALHFVFMFIFFQSVFIYKYGATPGQYFLKIRMQFENSDSLKFLRILLRQLGFWASALAFGIPWLAVMAHVDGKTFYDRLGEMKVISLKSNTLRLSFESEAKYWRSLMATFSVFVFLLFTATAWRNQSEIKTAKYTFEGMKKEKSFCSALKDVPLRDRLQTAIALNLVGQLSDRCFDKEADFVLWKTSDSEQKSLAYYAKSLTETEDAKELQYLAESCVGVSETAFGCRLASAFLDDNLKGLYQHLKKSDSKSTLLTTTLKYELAILESDRLASRQHFKELKAFSDVQPVKKYLISEIIFHAKNNTNDRKPATVDQKQSADLELANTLLGEL